MRKSGYSHSSVQTVKVLLGCLWKEWFKVGGA